MSRTAVRASAIIVKNAKILLIHRLNHGREYWVLPGGGVEEGETPEQAVTREVKEETNLDVISSAHSFFTHHNGEARDIHPCFICQVKDGQVTFVGTEAKGDPEDSYVPEWIDLHHIASLTLHPAMVKAKILEMYGNQ